jgi:hypothetical protein
MDKRQIARGLLLRGGLLLAALAGFAVVINLSWFDEPLDPEIERLIEPQPVSMQGNSYPLIYGFTAADDRDPLAAGLAIVETLRERYRQGLPIGLGDAEMAELLGGADLESVWQSGFASLPCNSRLSLDCADRLLEETAAGAADHPRLRVLLQRYEQILGVGRFEENQEFDVTTPPPAYGPLMAVGRIRLAQRFHREPTEAFLAAAAVDIGFWRTMLRDGGSLIAKMVALAGIRNDLELLSALMRERDLEPAAVASIETFLQPLTAEEQDIGESFLAEFRIALLSQKIVVLTPSEAPSLLTRLLLQENATQNEFYLRTITPMRLRAALDSRRFFEQQGYAPLTYNLRVFPPPLYNLGGKLLLRQQASNYNVQGYISRVHDTGGRLALVRLQAEIERSGGRSVEAVIRASAVRNPYTGEAMDYDSAENTIGFACATHNPNDICAVRIGRGMR